MFITNLTSVRYKIPEVICGISRAIFAKQKSESKEKGEICENLCNLWEINSKILCILSQNLKGFQFLEKKNYIEHL